MAVVPTNFIQNTQPIERDGNKLSGRLSAFRTSQGISNTNAKLRFDISIEFPMMPDAVEFARRADYIVQTNQVLPDGVHIYRKTDPLEIPISFRLHSFDRQYCPNGALTLLQLAARLHAFVLPLNLSGTGGATSVKANTKLYNDDGKVQQDANDNPSVRFERNANSKIYPPLTAHLELIFTAPGNVGVLCTGYVKEVSVKLNGPWMRGPNNSFNLPSCADFGFTFVHRPGHGNARNPLGVSDFIQVDAYAADVRDRFYQTESLVQVDNYQGFELGEPYVPQTLPVQALPAPVPGVFSPPTNSQGRPTVSIPPLPDSGIVPLINLIPLKSP